MRRTLGRGIIAPEVRERVGSLDDRDEIEEERPPVTARRPSMYKEGIRAERIKRGDWVMVKDSLGRRWREVVDVRPTPGNSRKVTIQVRGLRPFDVHRLESKLVARP